MFLGLKKYVYVWGFLGDRDLCVNVEQKGGIGETLTDMPISLAYFTVSCVTSLAFMGNYFRSVELVYYTTEHFFCFFFLFFSFW